MINQKVSDLTALGSISPTDILYVVSGGVSKKVTAAVLFTSPVITGTATINGTLVEVANKNRHYTFIDDNAAQPLFIHGVQYWDGGAFVADNSWGFGYAALYNNTGAYSNGFGSYALYNNTVAYSNGFGMYALYNNTGAYSSGFGYAALQNNTGANSNGFGYLALQNNTGANSSGFGDGVLYENTSGAGNSAFGHSAGRGYTDNNYSVFLGYDARTSVGTLTNAIVIGANARGTKSNQVMLGHTDVVETILRGNVGIGTTLAGPGVSYQRLNVNGNQLFVGTDSVQESPMLQIVPSYVVNTHASYTARAVFSVWDIGGAREGLRLEASGAAPMLGFFGHAAAVQPAKASHNNWAALSDVVSALVSIGIFDTV